MDYKDFDLSGNDSECERNEGFWSESDGELSDNVLVVTRGEVQAAGNGIRPYQFEPEAGQAEGTGDEIPGVHDDREDIEGRFGNNNWLD